MRFRQYENVETVASQTAFQRVNASSLAHKSPVLGEFFADAEVR